ncbi:MAG: hypothetical protein CMP47_15980 [Rickettsiales bacterium]|nr:hypothetical protein [Rickettsiales bacterium]
MGGPSPISGSGSTPTPPPNTSSTDSSTDETNSTSSEATAATREEIQDRILEAQEMIESTESFDVFNLSQSTNSINEFWNQVRGKEIDFKADLHEIEFTEADISRKFGLDALGQVSNMLELYRNLLLEFIARKVNAQNTGPASQQVNNSANAMNPQIEAHQPQAESFNQSVDSYNQAVQTFNEANDPPGSATQAEINAYNAAAANYNAAVTSYNLSANSTNFSINQYNADVTNYNLTIQQTNAQIDQINIQRQQEGQPPLPYQEELPLKDTIETKTPVATVPPGGTTSPIATETPVAIPTTVDVQLNDPQQVAFLDYLKESYFPFAVPSLSYITTFDRLFDLLLENKAVPFYQGQGQMDITMPDAPTYDRPEGQHVEGGTSGGMSLATMALGLDGDEMERVLSDGLIEEAFKQYNLEPPFLVPDQLQALTFAFITRNALRGALPGLSFLGNDLSSITSEGPDVRIALSLGAVSGVLGILRSNDLQNQVGPLIDELPGFEKLSAEEKQRLSQELSAVVTNKILQLSAELLANETGNESLLNVLQAGLITGQPLQEADQRFGLVTGAFEQLFADFSPTVVLGLVEEAVADTLTAGELGDEEAARLAGRISQDLADQGIPPTATELNDRVREVLTSRLGEEVSETLAREVTNTIALVGIAGQVRDDLVNTLLPQVGPEQAFQLTEEISLRLFGLSPDFSEGAIVNRREGEEGALSLTRAVRENTEVLYEREDGKLGQILADDFDDSYETLQELGPLLREVIDPGQLFFGLMAEGAGGTAFERGEADIRL